MQKSDAEIDDALSMIVRTMIIGFKVIVMLKTILSTSSMYHFLSNGSHIF